MAAPTKPATAYWGTTFEEFGTAVEASAATTAWPFKHATIPIGADYFKKRELQGACADPGQPTYTSVGPTRHWAIKLSEFTGVPASPIGGNYGMLIEMPASGGVTSRYQMDYSDDVVAGADYWVAFIGLFHSNWNLASSQLANSGSTFSVIGATHRNLGTANNGPIMGIGDCSFENGGPANVVPNWETGLNLVGTTAQNGDGALQQGHLWGITKMVWVQAMYHVRWDKGSNGVGEYFINTDATPRHRITGQTMQSAASSIQHRFGFYQGPSINHKRWFLCKAIARGPTRASVDWLGMSGGISVPVDPTPTAVDLSTLTDEMDVGTSEFSAQVGTATFSGGVATLSVDAGTTSSSIATAYKYNSKARSITFELNQLPAWTAGTGAHFTFATVDFGGGYRAVLRRRVNYGAGGSVITDKVELYLRENGADLAPQLYDWSNVNAGGSNRFRIALLADGRTVSYQLADDNLQYIQVGTRSFTTTTTVDKPAAMVMGTQLEATTLSVTPLIVNRAVGSTTIDPNPPTGGGGGGGGLTARGLTFDGTQVRVLPLRTTQIPLGMLFLAKRTGNSTTTTILSPIGISKDGMNGAYWERWYPPADPSLPNRLALVDGFQNPQGIISEAGFPDPGQWEFTGVFIDSAGVVKLRWYDYATRTFHHNENAGTIPPHAAISAATARAVIGSSIPSIDVAAGTPTGALSGANFKGTILMRGETNAAWDANTFQACVDPTTGVVLRNRILAQSGLVALQELGDGTTASNTATITDQKGTQTEETANRRGTTVVYGLNTAVTGTASTDTFNKTAHGYINADPVVFSAVTGGTGLTAGTTYFVVNALTNTFQVSTTVGGTALNFTTDITAATVNKVDAPYDVGGTINPTPTQTASVPQATGFALSPGTAMIDPADPTTGKATFTVDATAANAALVYTPNASPYGLFSSADGSSWDLVSWSATPTWNVTGIPLDATRFYAARHRNNAATPLEGDFSTPPVSLVVSSTKSDIDTPTGIMPVRSNGGTMDVYWDPNPAEDQVTEYDIYLREQGALEFPVTPAYQGQGVLVPAGVTVVYGGQTVSVAGKLVTPPGTFVNLADAVDYEVGVEAHRPS